MKNLPRKIKIFEQTYLIKFNNDICEIKNAIGVIRTNQQEIILANKYDNGEMPQQRVFRTLCHEIAHAMLWEIGEEKLFYNEKLADNLGNALCSFLTQNCKWK